MEVIGRDALDELSSRARGHARRRVNRNLHPEPGDPVQRLFNAIEPGSYVRPHRHRDGIWELFSVLRGRLLVALFSEDGRIERIETLAGGETVEIAPRVLHAIAALEPGTVILEIKPGPYCPTTDKDFAAWAPAEGEARTAAWMAWLIQARAGEMVPIPPPE